MKKQIMAMIIAIFSIFNYAHAENKPTIGIVNVEKVVTQSLAGKDLINKINDKRNQINNEIGKQEDGLKKERDELQKKQAVLAPDAFAKEQKAFEDKVVKFQQDVKEKWGNIEKSYASAMSEIDIVAKEITKKLAEENGFIIVIPASVALFYKDSTEITDNILKELDKKLTKVKL
jgi:outer membrane protein